MGVPQAGHHLRSAQAPCPPPEGPTCPGQSPRFSPFVSRALPPPPVPRLRHGQLGSYLSARTFGFLNERDPSVFACLCLSYLLSIIPWGSIPLVQRARFLSFFSLFFGGPHGQQGSCGQRRSDHGGPCPPFRISVFISFEETPRSGMAGHGAAQGLPFREDTPVRVPPAGRGVPPSPYVSRCVGSAPPTGARVRLGPSSRTRGRRRLLSARTVGPGAPAAFKSASSAARAPPSWGRHPASGVSRALRGRPSGRRPRRAGARAPTGPHEFGFAPCCFCKSAES